MAAYWIEVFVRRDGRRKLAPGASLPPTELRRWRLPTQIRQSVALEPNGAQWDRLEFACGLGRIAVALFAGPKNFGSALTPPPSAASQNRCRARRSAG